MSQFREEKPHGPGGLLPTQGPGESVSPSDRAHLQGITGEPWARPEDTHSPPKAIVRGRLKSPTCCTGPSAAGAKHTPGGQEGSRQKARGRQARA